MSARDKILEVAQTRFAENGYAATSVRQIAEAADVNPAMIHYYFGSKEDLLRAALETALEPLAEAVKDMQQAGEVSPEAITRTLMGLVAAHPNLPLLVVREVMLPGGVMQAHFAKNLAPRVGGALPAILAREAEAGRVRQDLPPAIGSLALMAMALFPFIVRPMAEQVLEVDLDDASLDAFAGHVSEFVRRGFAP